MHGKVELMALKALRYRSVLVAAGDTFMATRSEARFFVAVKKALPTAPHVDQEQQQPIQNETSLPLPPAVLEAFEAATEPAPMIVEPEALSEAPEIVERVDVDGESESAEQSERPEAAPKPRRTYKRRDLNAEE